jgi:hypothetical protein
MPGLAGHELGPLLQTAIGPVILISGVGLLLLTMTNRLARVIDRTRSLIAEPSPEKRYRNQLAIFWKRARILRASIMMAASSALAVAIIVILLFLSILEGIELQNAISTLFILGMVFLIGSIILFLYDVNLTLSALKLEMSVRNIFGPYTEPTGDPPDLLE